VASLRKFSPVVFRPAVAGLFEWVLAAASHFLGSSLLGRKAMRRRRALQTPKDFASRKQFPHTGRQAVQNAINEFCSIGVISVIRG
jgi:hypothetical protein